MHAQALLVLDDQDFHERQEMLSLARHRAIATALNSLVFHTHCPAAPAAQNSAQAPRIDPLSAMQGKPTKRRSSMQNPEGVQPTLRVPSWPQEGLSVQLSRPYITVPFYLQLNTLGASTGIDSSTAGRMLGEWAPRLLRELYERDVRRPYCPPALWLEPFNAVEASSGAPGSTGERFNAAAVMRALLQGGPPSGPPPGTPR